MNKIAAINKETAKKKKKKNAQEDVLYEHCCRVKMDLTNKL